MNTETLVLGGGPAGAAAAIWLARAGRPVTLWEKDRLPTHRICGEFLGTEAQHWLSDLGIDLDALGAVPVRKIRWLTASRSIDAPLGFTGRSLSRRVLDAALLDQAAVSGVQVLRGMNAHELRADGTVISANTEVRPQNLFLATGRQAIRGMFAVPEGGSSGHPGYKSYFRLAPAERAALAGCMEVALLRDGFAVLQMVERDAANLHFRVSRERWEGQGGNFAALLADIAQEVPNFYRRLTGAVPLLDRPLAIPAQPFGYICKAVHVVNEPGWRVGEQAALVRSLPGGGLGLSMHSARLATAAMLTGAGKAQYYRKLASDAGGAVQRSIWLQKWLEKPGSPEKLAVLLGVVPGLMRLGVRLTALSSRSVRRAGSV